MGEGKRSALRVEFDGQIRLEFHGANVTSDAGLLAYRELDEALGLTTEVDELSIYDPRNLGNFLRRLALPQAVQYWSLTTLREKLIKIGAKIVRHARYVTFQLAEVAVPRRLFAAILDRIARLAIPPPRVT
jgi:hypothetical protein